MDSYKISEILPVAAQNELTGFDPLTQKLLHNRGIATRQAAEKFLNPDYERDCYDPFLILNMDRAVERILRAIDGSEKIVVYGDYDCDGIPGSVILHDFFKKIGYKNFSNYIPHRHKEGYGLNTDAVDEFAKSSTALLITVDCGITDVEEVKHAQSLGIDVIITDHHLPARRSHRPAEAIGEARVGASGPQETLPPAYAILNSKQKGDTYPDKMLCGAGVAFKLVQGLIKKKGKEWGIKDGWEKWLLDMAGLATIADLVPLQNENRTLAYYGLKVLRKSPRVGLQKLLRKMNVNQRELTEGDVAFMIAPRINAASRMDIPHEAFRLLSTEDENVADELSDHLHNLNDERKGLVASMVREAKTHMEAREMREVIVIGNPKWRPGVLGLLASRLVEDYRRPAFVWGRGEEIELKGSCRSDGTVNMVEMMNGVSEGLFLNVGGHEFSGGFSVSREKVHLLEDELVLVYQKIRLAETSIPKILIDCALSLDEINSETYRKIEKLAPFGIGNPKPTFLFNNVEIEEVKNFGKEKNHLELIFKNSRGEKVSAIGFFTSANDFKKEIIAGTTTNLIATFEKSFFRNRAELRLRIVDIL
ncbi:MAG: DHH family phosphoesterase [Patescibacteria group bacterium]